VDVKRIKVIAFDVFGTLVKFDGVPQHERDAYAHAIQQPTWSPLTLPDSWKKLPAFDDCVRAIKLLRQNFMVVTLSNGPIGLQAHLLRHNRISVDAIVPLELAQVFKPNHAAYVAAETILGVPAENFLMVSANEKFGDIEASVAMGMQSQLIRHEEVPTLMNLVWLLSGKSR